LLCINGTGILNSWLKHNFATSLSSYGDMNDMASLSPVGAKGLSIIPFGNGAERVLENKETIALFTELILISIPKEIFCVPHRKELYFPMNTEWIS
jgi:hypothetical protein